MIIIAPDKFKGTLTAPEVCDTIRQALADSGISCAVESHPLADGGEGSQNVILRRPERVAQGVYLDRADNCACVVSAETVGFGNFDLAQPLMTRSSRGLGEAILVAASYEPTTIYVAVGGTATSDGGVGMLAALGAKFFDASGYDISSEITAEKLLQVERLDLSSVPPLNLVAVSDVKAQLVGGELSAVDFARQKAVAGEDLTVLPEALAKLGSLVDRRSDFDGAGGGIGFALCSVLGAQGLVGSRVAADSLQLDRLGISLVITGEGRLDRQTYLGNKLVNEIYNAASSHRIPCLIVPGCAADCAPYPHIVSTEHFAGTPKQRLLAAIHSATPLINSLL